MTWWGSKTRNWIRAGLRQRRQSQGQDRHDEELDPATVGVIRVPSIN
ncbi:MAG: hypothetical protein LBI10_09635 [Deltaproteobacteria bacterium]|nr:hypothetical protein [Deltaproteobacteria bacterium]